MSERWLVVAVGVVGGVLGIVLEVPAGALLGSLLAVGLYTVVRDRPVRPPSWLGPTARAAVGMVVGSTVTWEVVTTLGRTLPWALAATVLITVVGTGCGWLLHRWSPLDRPTAMIACAPGGLAEMTALAEQVGAQAEVVAAIHLSRKLLCLGAAVLLLVVTT